MRVFIIIIKNHTFKYVGVDSEWKPTCAMGVDVENQKCVSLVQVATSHKIYLLDLLKLTKIMDEHDSERITKEFFCNQRIIKIGNFFILKSTRNKYTKTLWQFKFTFSFFNLNRLRLSTRYKNDISWF